MKNLKKLVGFPIGVMMLAISYIAVNYIYGSDVYSSKLSQLVDATSLINQVLCAGIYYTVLGLFVKKLVDTINNKDMATGKDFIKCTILVILTGAIGFAIDKFAAFEGEELVDILLSTPVVTLIIGYVGYLAINTINVHKINKSLKNK